MTVPHRLSRTLLVAALAAGLGACATTAVVPPPTAGQAAGLEAAQRERERSAARTWGLEGRIAVSTARDAGSGRIEWQQSGDRFDIQLTAPITRQGWRLSGAPGQASLEGLAGGTRTGADAEALLREATGWEIPVRSLPAWVRGLRADPATAVVRFGADGRLASLAENGWTIDYTWPAAPAAMPSRVEARRGEARVRLVVDRWTDGTASP
ncbi:lipoprotein insertase outer membrane protein LolB [Lysobacter xanthus]